MSFLDDLGGFLNDSESSIVDIVKAVKGTPTPKVQGTPQPQPVTRPDQSTQGQKTGSTTNWWAIAGVGVILVLATSLIFTIRR